MFSCQHNIKMPEIYTIWETKASWKLYVGLEPQRSDLLCSCLRPAVDSDLSTISARVPDCKMSTTRASSEAGHLWQACFIWLHGRIRLRANWIILLWVTSWLRIEAGPWEMRPGSWKTLSRITAASLTFLKSSITGGSYRKIAPWLDQAVNRLMVDSLEASGCGGCSTEIFKKIDIYWVHAF